jgi:FAD synthetase
MLSNRTVPCVRLCIVWEFLRSCKLPYCSLYDVGYTSIGNIHNTVPNEALAIESGDPDRAGPGAPRRYRPAYELKDPSLERCNRVAKKANE